MTRFNAGPSWMWNVDEVAVLEGFTGRRGPFGLKGLDCFESAMTVVSDPRNVCVFGGFVEAVISLCRMTGHEFPGRDCCLEIALAADCITKVAVACLT